MGGEQVELYLVVLSAISKKVFMATRSLRARRGKVQPCILHAFSTVRTSSGSGEQTFLPTPVRAERVPMAGLLRALRAVFNPNPA